jgi:hypothetical protein
MKPFLLCLLLAATAIYVSSSATTPQPDGIVAPYEPKQTAATAGPWKTNGFRFTPLADFSLETRLLSHERYWFDHAAAVSPIDLALGWANMSDQRVIERLSMSQGGRWLRWRPSAASS